MADDRNKAIEAALSALDKQFGKGSVMRLGSKEAVEPIAVISTGSISFDLALGVGGVAAWLAIARYGGQLVAPPVAGGQDPGAARDPQRGLAPLIP